MKKDINFLLQAAIVSQRSTCARRKVGCVIVNKTGLIMSTGFNGVPRYQVHCTDTPCEGACSPSGTDLDLCLAIHAEQNALMQCRDIMNIGTVYITHSPCMHCAKMLANTSVKGIYYTEEYAHTEAIKFLKSCQISISHIEESMIQQEVDNAV